MTTDTHTTTKAATACAECGGAGRYTFGNVTLCTMHRGLLPKFEALSESAELCDYR